MGAVGWAVAFGASIPILLGFGTSGIVSGSVAATIQSYVIGNVAAGGAFAFLQSLGASGTFAAIATTGAAAGVGGAALAATSD